MMGERSRPRLRRAAGLLILKSLWLMTMAGSDAWGSHASVEFLITRPDLSDKAKIDSMLSLARSHLPDSTKKAVSYCHTALTLARKTNNLAAEPLALFYEGKAYRLMNQYEQAIESLSNAYHGFVKDQSKAMAGESQTELGQTYFQIPDIESAVGSFNQALSLFLSLEDSAKIANAYANLGRCCRKTGDLDQALQYSLKSLTYHENNNHFAYNTMSIVYATMKDYDKALKYQIQAMQIREALGLKKELIGSLNNLGLISARAGDLVPGLRYLEKAVKIAEAINDDFELCRLLNNIGFMYDELRGMPAKSLPYFQRALQLSDSLGEYGEKANLLINIAEVKTRMGQHMSALEYYQQGIALSKKIGVMEITRNGFLALSRYYEGRGLFRNALEQYKIYAAYQDSLLNQSTRDKIADLNAKYESEKKDQENRTVRFELENKKLQQTRLYFLLAGAVLIAVAGFVLFSIKARTNQKLHAEIFAKKGLEKRLEKEISERTRGLRLEIEERKNTEHELNRLKADLENEVQKRTGELKKRMQELEAFKASAIDREFRIQELREKVQVLQEKGV